MAFGPELVSAQVIEIEREFARNRVRRVNAGEFWISLLFSRDRSLLISWDSECYGVCRVTPEEIRELENASGARPPVVDAIRSHIVGADLWASVQVNRDRVMKLEFRRVIGAGFFQTRHLICELCGRYSNVMVTDEENRVIEAAKHILPEDNRYRTIAPGSVYVPPPPVRGIPIDEVDVSGGDIDGIAGIGKPLLNAIKKLGAEEVSASLKFFKNINLGLCPNPAGRLLPAPSFFYIKFEAEPHGYVTLSHVLLPGAVLLSAGDSLSAARSAVVSAMANRAASSCRKKISAILDKLERVNSKRIEEYASLISGGEEIKRLKTEGQLILANVHAIRPRAASAVLISWTESGAEEKLVSLDPDKDASANAEARFAKYRRKKRAVAAADALLPKLYHERDELGEQRVLLECNDDLNTLYMMMEELRPRSVARARGEAPKKLADAAPHRRAEFLDDSAMLFYGLSANGNRYVTFKAAKTSDLWFHAQGIPGAHVILRFAAAPDDETKARMTRVAASCAAFYSGGRDSGGVRVDFALRRYVRAIQGGGAANVTYREFDTVIVDPSLWREIESRIENSRVLRG
ncbi:MAG: NFACT family protein [Synergistaceae bacterium]|nr:NFACT family protein [Synergistaceae bacterium]